MLTRPLAKAYPAIFHPEENGGFFIEFPDIQGAYTGINEPDIAYGIVMAEEVLGMVLTDMIEHGDSLPAPTPINDVAHDTASFVTLVRVDLEQFFKDTKPVKKTLTIPTWADNLGKKAGVNFSQLLTEAIANIDMTVTDVHKP